MSARDMEAAFGLLSRTVREAIGTMGTGPIGTPVAVRLVAHLSADHGLVVRAAARA
ncbi:MAG: hypothetical protein HY721_10725, partial [Planctomycetes bacterium]|nr:hypothetical protein [Planctomycetota bacterium]